MAQSIREETAKRLLGGLSRPCVSISGSTDLESLPDSYPWLLTSSLVVKPDVLLKRRGKSGLVKLNVKWNEARDWLAQAIGKELTIEGLSGELSHFIVEEFFPHDDATNEFYIAIRTLQEGDEILFSHRGGIHVGDVEQHARKLLVEINEDGDVPDIPFGSLFDDVKDALAQEALPRFVQSLYSRFCDLHFAFLEINPFCFDAATSSFVILDAAAKLDHTADFICEDKWGHVEFPSPFGRKFTDAERYIRELDSKTGASLKLTILNPKGRIWTMIAGGGASVVYSDTICDLGQAHELANYGEYSGAPTEVTTYEYAKTLLGLVTAEDTFRPEGKILLIGGGIANFTSVAATFTGIIRAIREMQQRIREYKVRIYVRRGGPNYQDGLKLMRELGAETGLPIKVYGPETYMTAIIPIALDEDKGICASTIQSSMRVSTWHEMRMEDVEHDDQFQTADISATTPKKRTFAEANGTAPASEKRRVLFTDKTRCFVWGLQERAVQEMMDFDHVCNRDKPSVAAIIYEFSVPHLRPFYFGTDEIFIPVVQTLKDATEKFPEVDTLINFASMRSADKVTRLAMDFPQVKTIAIIAEGVPERKTRELLVTARRRNITIIGPATVGGIKPGCFRIGNTGGMLENIMNSKLYRPGSVAFVTKSGGMLNEMNNILRIKADGCYEGVAIGGDRFPGTTMMDHLLRYEQDPGVKVMLLLGEVGGTIEYEVVRAIKEGTITKPLVAWCVGTCAPLFSTEVSFGHAGAWAGTDSEQAAAKNKALRDAGAYVPNSFQDLGEVIKDVYDTLIEKGLITRMVEPALPRVPMDYAWAKKLGLVRKPKGFVSTISDDRGEELVYAGWPISKVMQGNMGVGGVLSLLWFKRPLPDYCYRYLEMVLMLTADHGPAVCGAHNTIVTARAGKDLISSLISGLCTIGDRFGGACDQAACQFLKAYDDKQTPEEFVKSMASQKKLIMGIGHKIKSVHNPDMRVQLLKTFCKTNFSRPALIGFAEDVERVTTKKKDTLILNVDGLIGVSMVDMLFGCGAFSETEARDYISVGCINGLFVLGRSIGFIGHYLDQKRLKQGLYRHDVDDIAYVLPDLSTSHH
ncbi:unnamed protein product [Vitrella brassicaformis CCMP3155]|uniref:ATP citrate synthase n=1 Tax=Vitrella brassicaformis (strain CCMP3155) TaxID=1169540 RepID=A0A0G4H7A6_VITBC|nr:unnamed protein product [Vitrella brassicaformis CCMP3155]|eukprot:CEM39625.1 unnamed protein product [Vitrella brassicaformis CCMP3155]